MAGFIGGVDRGQTVLFRDRLEDWIGEDHFVRVADRFPEKSAGAAARALVITPHGLKPSHHAPIPRPLWTLMIASHAVPLSWRILKARERRRLNPLFFVWLMCWPIGHALCACSATDFTLWKHYRSPDVVAIRTERNDKNEIDIMFFLMVNCWGVARSIEWYCQCCPLSGSATKQGQREGEDA